MLDGCEAIRKALFNMEDVDSETTTFDANSNAIRVVYKGTAKQANVFAALNYRKGLRPAGCTLLVYRKEDP